MTRRRTALTTPKAGPVTIRRPNGTVEVQPALTYAEREAMARSEDRLQKRRRQGG